MEHIGIGTGSRKACHQGILKHIATTAGILADDHPGRFFVPGPPFQLTLIPTQESAHFKCVVSGQIHIGFSTEAVCSEILAHN